MANCEKCRYRIGCENYEPKSTTACGHYAYDERDVQQLNSSPEEKLTELLLSAEKVADETGFFNCHKSRPKAELIADYLIENGVIVPPCKVGDKIYYLNTRFHISLYQNYVYEATVVRIFITEKFITIVFQIRDENGCTETVAEEKDIGKNVFFSREEAERVLKGK